MINQKNKINKKFSKILTKLMNKKSQRENKEFKFKNNNKIKVITNLMIKMQMMNKFKMINKKSLNKLKIN